MIDAVFVVLGCALVAVAIARLEHRVRSTAQSMENFMSDVQAQLVVLTATLAAIGSDVTAVANDVASLEAQLQNANDSSSSIDLSDAIALAQGIRSRLEAITVEPAPAAGDPTDGHQVGGAGDTGGDTPAAGDGADSIEGAGADTTEGASA